MVADNSSGIGDATALFITIAPMFLITLAATIYVGHKRGPLLALAAGAGTGLLLWIIASAAWLFWFANSA